MNSSISFPDHAAMMIDTSSAIDTNTGNKNSFDNPLENSLENSFNNSLEKNAATHAGQNAGSFQSGGKNEQQREGDLFQALLAENNTNTSAQSVQPDQQADSSLRQIQDPVDIAHIILPALMPSFSANDLSNTAQKASHAVSTSSNTSVNGIATSGQLNQVSSAISSHALSLNATSPMTHNFTLSIPGLASLNVVMNNAQTGLRTLNLSSNDEKFQQWLENNVKPLSQQLSNDMNSQVQVTVG